MKIAIIHRVDSSNLGDTTCNPFAYCPDLPPADVFDIHDYTKVHADVIVLGGGGLFHGTWPEFISDLVVPNGPLLIAWGCGLNQHGTRSQIWPEYLDRFSLVGLRDFTNPWNYVPCPSCLHSAFDRVLHEQPEPVTGLHIYERQPIIGPDAPRMSNNSNDLYTTLKFLASGRVILTDSWHGAYWALLLNRRVLLWKPDSNRFLSFKEPLTECNECDWEHKLTQATGIDGYLTECRILNRVFEARVRRLLSRLGSGLL